MDFDEDVKKAWDSLKKKSLSKKEEKKQELKEAMNAPEKTDEKQDSEEKTEDEKIEGGIESRLTSGKEFGESELPEPERFALRTMTPRVQRSRGFAEEEEEDEKKKFSYEKNEQKYSKNPSGPKVQDDKNYSTIDDSVKIQMDTPGALQDRTIFDKPDFRPAIMRDPLMPSMKNESGGKLYDEVAVWKPNYNSKEQEKRENDRKYKVSKAEKVI